MTIKTLQATSFVKKLRGGSQARLLMAGKDAYVVKFVTNPQHRRTLINEVISSALLRFLGVSTPPIALVQIDSNFLLSNPEVLVEGVSSRASTLPGLHFGSMYLGNPWRTPVSESLPPSLESSVQNCDEFLGALVFDLWVGNVDKRQVIFAKDKGGWRVWMIDHGLAFNGQHWQFIDSPSLGMYNNPAVYDLRSLDTWLERLTALPRCCLNDVIAQIPPHWVGQDESLLQRLLERLWRRRSRVPDLVRACLLHARLAPTYSLRIHCERAQN